MHPSISPPSYGLMNTVFSGLNNSFRECVFGDSIITIAINFSKIKNVKMLTGTRPIRTKTVLKSSKFNEEVYII